MNTSPLVLFHCGRAPPGIIGRSEEFWKTAVATVPALTEGMDQ